MNNKIVVILLLIYNHCIHFYIILSLINVAIVITSHKSQIYFICFYLDIIYSNSIYYFINILNIYIYMYLYENNINY